MAGLEEKEPKGFVGGVVKDRKDYGSRRGEWSARGSLTAGSGRRPSLWPDGPTDSQRGVGHQGEGGRTGEGRGWRSNEFAAVGGRWFHRGREPLRLRFKTRQVRLSSTRWRRTDDDRNSSN